MSITKIAEVTVSGSPAASISFSSISGSFTDLMLTVSGKTNGSGDANIALQFNGSTASFSYRLLYGTGSATASASASSNGVMAIPTSTYTANTFNNGSFYIPNYAGSTNKSFSIDNVTENNATGSYQDIWAGLWSNTAAITSITLGSTNGSWIVGSTATLYGVLKGSSGGVTVS